MTTPWLAALALQAAAALPSDVAPTQQADARCARAFAYLGDRHSEREADLAAGFLFFVGRMLGRDPAMRLDTLLTGSGMDEAAAGREVLRCAAEIEALDDRLFPRDGLWR